MLEDSLQAGIVCDTGDPATLGDGPALHFVEICGEVDRPGISDVAAHPEAVHRGAFLPEVSDPRRVEAAANHYLYPLKALQVQAGPDLFNQVRRHPAPFERGIQTDPLQPVAQGFGHPQALLGFVLEGVHQHIPWHLWRYVSIEGLGCRDGIAHGQDQCVGDGARGRQAPHPGPVYGGAPLAPTQDGGILHTPRYHGMHVTGPEAYDRYLSGSLHTLSGRCGPPGAMGQDSQERGLVEPVGRVGAMDSEDNLLLFDGIALFQGKHLSAMGWDHLLYELKGFLYTAEQAPPAGEELYRGEGAQPFLVQYLLCPAEVDIGGLPRDDPFRDVELQLGGLGCQRTLAIR